jgi:urease accessory protein UreF
MAISSNIAARPGKGLAGDARALAQRLGSPEDLEGLGSALVVPGSAAVVDLGSLRRFLSTYVEAVLIPVELPLVFQGFHHASRGALSELIALDQLHAPKGIAQQLADSSQKVGRTHLRRMRPLRGERRVQRYWRAVQRGEAYGWHTIVFGLVLAVYGMPLRQGLLSFGGQTVRGFINSARGRLTLDNAGCQELENEMALRLPPAVEHLFSDCSGARLRLV